MARDKINSLTDSLSGFFGNTSESMYDYNKQRETYAYQESMYTKSEKHFYKNQSLALKTLSLKTYYKF